MSRIIDILSRIDGAGTWGRPGKCTFSDSRAKLGRTGRCSLAAARSRATEFSPAGTAERSLANGWNLSIRTAGGAYSWTAVSKRSLRLKTSFLSSAAVRAGGIWRWWWFDLHEFSAGSHQCQRQWLRLELSPLVARSLTLDEFQNKNMLIVEAGARFRIDPFHCIGKNIFVRRGLRFSGCVLSLGDEGEFNKIRK